MGKNLRRIGCLLIVSLLFLTACSSKKEFTIQRMYASGVYESTSGQFVRIDDISITGTVGKNEITVPAKAAFAETDIVDFSSDIGEKNAVGGCLLECIYITAQDKDGKEFQVDLHPGDKVKVLSADFPVFEFK